MGREDGIPASDADLGVAAESGQPCADTSPYPVTIIDYRPHHLKHPTFYMSALTYRTFNAFGMTPYEALSHAMESAQTRHTIVTNDGRVIAFAGAWMYFRGVGGGCCRVFTAVAKDVKPFVIGIARCMRLLIKSMDEQWQPHRVETLVAQFNMPALRLAHACRFEIESVMREYDLEHNNYYMMVRR